MTAAPSRNLATTPRFATALTTLALAAVTLAAAAQDDKPAAAPHPPYPAASACLYERSGPPCPVRYFHLRNADDQNKANEILVALRNILDPGIKIYLVASDNTIVMYAPGPQLDRAAEMIRELDTPATAFRLVYTVTAVDNGQRTGTEHYAQAVVAGQRTSLKQGTKIPVATGSSKGTASTAEMQTEFTYLDVGINLDSTVESYGGATTLRYKVEQSSVAPDPVTIAGISEPVIRQSALTGEAVLVPGKPTPLGSLDITGSNRRLDVTVELQPAP